MMNLPDFYEVPSVRAGWGSRGDECPLCGRYMFEGTEAGTKYAWYEHMAEHEIADTIEY